MIFVLFLRAGDVCFESVDKSCTLNANTTSTTGTMMWRFSPKSNKCVQMLADALCPSKNLFHSESACSSVCPGKQEDPFK